MSDIQMVRMLAGVGPYNAGEVRGMDAARAEDLRLRDVCEFVSRGAEGKISVTRASKSAEDAANLGALRRARMEGGGDGGLFSDDDVAELFSKIKSLEANLKRALSEAEPLKKAKDALTAELKIAHEDNKAASVTITKLTKQVQKLEETVAMGDAQLSALSHQAG